MSALYVREGRKYIVAPPDVVLDRARDLLDQQFRCGTRVLDDPLRLEIFLKEKLVAREQEVFAVILLDSEERLIEYVELFRGTHNSAPVHPREIVRVSLAHRAANVVLVHNHPSGNPKPSEGDIACTRRVEQALAHVDIKVADHFVIGKKMTSFRVSGLLGR